MTTLALGLVGGAIGFAITGTPIGFQIGFLAGSLAGSLIDPPKVQGPRLGDLKLQRSTYGAMLPWLWGKGRIAGNVIDQTDLTEHEQKSGGKGGPEQINYTYSASFAIALCQTPIFGRDAIVGVLRLWADGRLIWDQSSSADEIPCTVYVGSETQEADPTFEAIHGVGNQPGYRGLAYLVFTDYDLTEFGNRIPNIEAEVYTKGGDIPWRVSSFTPWASDLTTNHVQASATYRNGVITASEMGATAPAQVDTSQFTVDGTQIGATITDYITPPDEIAWIQGGDAPPNLNSVLTYYNDGGSIVHWHNQFPANVGEYVQGHDMSADGLIGAGLTRGRPMRVGEFMYTPTRVGLGNVILYRSACDGGLPGAADGVFYDLAVATAAANVMMGASDDGYVYVGTSPSGVCQMWKFDTDLNLIHHWDDTATGVTGLSFGISPFFVYRGLVCYSFDSGAGNSIALVQIDGSNVLSDYGLTIASGNSALIYLGNGLALDDIGVFSLIPPADPVLLSQIVSDLTENTPLGSPGSPSTMEYDVSELTDEVRWYVLASQMTVRNAIQALRPIFFFDAVESDDLVKFRKRGLTGSIATIPDDDLCGRPGGEEAGDPLLTVRQREQGLPRTVTLTYIDVDADYQTGAQSSPRQTTLSEQDVTLEVAVGLTADEGLQKCLTVHTAEWVERESFQFSTTRKWAYLEPCDVVTVRGREIRLRTRTEAPDGTIKWEGVLDAPSLYTQTAPGAGGGFTPQEPIGIPVDTQLVLLDIPILSLSDAPYGFYAAAGPAADGRWSGFGLYKSLDGGTSYELAASSSTRSIIGATAVSTVGSPTVTGTLSAYAGGDVIEEASLCVVLTDPDAELVSVTSAALLNGANLCAISRGTTTSGSPACTVDLWELLQFRDAVLIAANTYVISGFLRGRNGTSTSHHGTADTFVFLPVTNVDAPAAELGICLDYKAVTYGQALADVAAVDFINTGQSADAYFEEVGDGLPPFTGDTGSPTAPAQGQVPAPSAGDCAAGKYLDACGGWSVPAGGASPPTGTGYVHITAGVQDAAAVALTFQIEMIIGDGINPIVTGAYPTGVVSLPRAGTLTGWSLLSCDAASPTSGAIVIDLWKDTYANYPPSVSESIIPSGTKPTITATNLKGTSSGMTGWTTAVAAGDVIFPNVDSVTSLKAVKLVLIYTATG